MFPHYWSIIKEHINHFDVSALSDIFIKKGFKVIDVFRKIIPYDNNEFGYPSLLIVVQKNGLEDATEVTHRYRTREAIQEYFEKSQAGMECMRMKIQKWKESQQPLAIWGCSHELNILSTFTEIAKCNLVAVVDKSALKQGRDVLGKKKSRKS